MLLMIDNYDSFTYNLVQYFGELKTEVKVVRNDELSVEQIEALAPERIVLSPVPAPPTRPASRWPLSSASPASCRCSVSALAIRASARPSAAKWCGRGR